MAGIIFGTAGIPHSAKERSSVSGIARVRELSLQAMELEFVYGVRMKEAEAEKVNSARERNKISLSVHAPFYINLNSKEKAKIKTSQERILHSARIGKICGAGIVVFHPAFYGGMEKEQVYENVKKALDELSAVMKKEKNPVRLGMETTGKGSQFGTVKEICSLSKEVPGIFPVIDFSHLHARSNGGLKTQDDFGKILSEIKKADKGFLDGLHMHASGIKYSDKGERNHLTMQEKENDFDYRLMLKALHKFKVSGTVICESPNLETDALLMQKFYMQL